MPKILKNSDIITKNSHAYWGGWVTWFSLGQSLGPITLAQWATCIESGRSFASVGVAQLSGADDAYIKIQATPMRDMSVSFYRDTITNALRECIGNAGTVTMQGIGVDWAAPAEVSYEGSGDEIAGPGDYTEPTGNSGGGGILGIFDCLAAPDALACYAAQYDTTKTMVALVGGLVVVGGGILLIKLIK